MFLMLTAAWIPKSPKNQHQWLTPVIIATEAEIRRITV
jgi:hypothetical protein